MLTANSVILRTITYDYIYHSQWSYIMRVGIDTGIFPYDCGGSLSLHVEASVVDINKPLVQTCKTKLGLYTPYVIRTHSC